MKVVTILGTRPEIIRISSVIALLEKHVNHVLVHTGQNYDYELNEVFFEELGVKKPDYFMLEKFELVYHHLLIDFNSWHYGKNKESVFHKIMDMRRLLQENGIPSK